MTLQVVNGHKVSLQGIPKDWTKTKMRRAVAKYQLEKNDKDNPVVLSLTKTGVRVKTDLAFGKSTENYIGHQIVEQGQFVFTPRDFDATPILCGISPVRGCISNLYLVFDVAEDIHPQFLEYYFWGLKYGYDYFAKLSHGMRFSFNREQFERIPFAFPCTSTQAVIVDHLDRETRGIDDLITEKNSFITLLREKRNTAISQAVTKGIDTNVCMKSSGQDWLGDVPAHWDAVSANWLFRPSKKLALPDDQLLSATQKYGVIPLAEFEKLEERKVTLAVTNLEKRKHVEIGDFVISMRSMDGGLEKARARGSVRSSYIVLKFTDEVDGRFYGYLLKSKRFIQALRLTANFIRDGQDMHFGHFRAVKLPRLPLAEQDAIANHLDRETARIDSLISETERSIALLKEKRAALITAAVTGKIDVRSAA